MNAILLVLLINQYFSVPHKIITFAAIYDLYHPALGGGQAPKPDPRIKVNLENQELWRQFHKIGTEMIITKMGR